MAKGRARSAITGRYISRAAAARHPKTSVVSSASGSGRATGGGRNRSAITGKFISNAAAARHPKTSVRESGN
jgi:hypothetical protein